MFRRAAKPPALRFEGALLAGLARRRRPLPARDLAADLRAEFDANCRTPYAEIAHPVMRPVIGGRSERGRPQGVLDDAYAGFHHPAIAPLRQIAPASWLLELFHGPTLAFKDLAMQVVSRLMDRALRRKGARATIVGATSGDTGAAAIEAFRGLDMIDIFILHPKGRVTEVQRRQMTTATSRTCTTSRSRAPSTIARPS